MQDYRRLRVYGASRALAVEVRKAIRRFPRTGYSSLQSQVIRAAESILFNIAEGCGSSTPKEFGRYLDISIKSTCELEAELELAKDYGVLAPAEWKKLSEGSTSIRRMLCRLRSKVLAENRQNR
jgi:four helix bundle protein